MTRFKKELFEENGLSFSERYGHKTLRSLVQLDSMDLQLKNGLWNILELEIWSNANEREHFTGKIYISKETNKAVYNICLRLWHSYFKLTIDTLPEDWSVVISKIKLHFFSCKWFEVYDFIEFCSNNYYFGYASNNFNKLCNQVLEREMSAYRFINGKICQITELEQIDEIETAIKTTNLPVRQHLKRALELLSNRDTPDYRNSIKESVSALESLVCVVVGEKGTLGSLTKKLEKEVNLHPALTKSISNLYGYTSDESGIRHALTDAGNTKFEDAKFMLVVCSAFVNFVETKFDKKA